MPDTLPDFAGITGELRSFGLTPATFHAADDRALVAALETISVLRHEVERHQALAAAEVARRSRVGFGQQSPARRDGHTSTGAMLQSITRATKREAAALVAVSEMVAEVEAAAEFERMRHHDPDVAAVLPPAEPPWFAPLGDAVVSGAITVAVAEAIRSGLGEPGGDVDGACLRAELVALLPLCVDAHADSARRAARQVRDRLDTAGVEARAAAQHEQQL